MYKPFRSLVVSLLIGACGQGGGATADAPGAGTADSAPDGTGGPMVTFTNLRDGVAANAGLVALQDADGPWTALQGAAGVYAGPVHGQRYGLAVACIDAAGVASVSITYAAVSDGMSRFGSDCVRGADASVPVTGAIRGVSDPVAVGINFAGAYVATPATSGYSLSTLPGAGTLLARQLVGGRPTALVMSSVNVVAGTPVDVDFAGGFAPVIRNLAVDPAVPSMAVRYEAPGVSITIDEVATHADTATYRALPLARVGAGLLSLGISQTTPGGQASSIRYFKEAVDQAMTVLPAYQPAQPPTLVATPYPGLELVVSKLDAATRYTFRFATAATATAGSRSWGVSISPGWLAAAPATAAGTTFTVRLPDLTGVSGWSPSLALTAGQRIVWTIAAEHSTGLPVLGTYRPGDFPYRDGGEYQVSVTSGSLVP